ncbi:universal stress protein [Roseovarius sp. S1116L3]|uniref:universal stress protein n=1 Tax=Roseovarius roseus TaxID=3342636 RepID=UPI003B66F044
MKPADYRTRQSGEFYFGTSGESSVGVDNSVSTDNQEAYVEEQREVAAKDLEQFVKATGVRCSRPIVRFGLHPTAEEIMKAAKEEVADLVVLGTEGRSGLERFFLGSVAEAVLRMADRDVLAVPPASA